ncbi:hypothetical protein VUJ46_09225 [Chryseobacterium sp. MYb264]|uniref:hypothetical protein n=1 Tax=Chryseobacterium sp. MYb264 TaxID=2745153 RepID=UPI002E142A2F|nr:hypothetical protein VUJ46_09225 [Chryseobacterium sp. MYb264]
MKNFKLKSFGSLFLLLAFLSCKENKVQVNKNESTHVTTLSASASSLPPVEKEKISVKSEDKKPEVNLADLKGNWAVNCENELTELSFENNEGYLSLYSDNAVYINVTVKKSEDNSGFMLYFKNTSSQKKFYSDKPTVNDSEVSKDKEIGKLSLKNGALVIDWYGLYNLKTGKHDFKNEFVMIKENGGKSPVILHKCS